MRGVWRKQILFDADGAAHEVAVPVGQESTKFLNGIGVGRTFSDHRNKKQEGLFHILCGLVAGSLDTTEENIRHRVIHKAGYYETWIDAFGREHEIPKSIRHMKRDEFNRCFQDCIPILAMWVSVAPKEIVDRFNELVDPPDRRARSGGPRNSHPQESQHEP